MGRKPKKQVDYKVKENTYVHIEAFMVNDLHLSGNELMIYAIIHGFSQDGISWFEGSRQYLSAWCQTTTETITNNLKKLVEKGLIECREKQVHGITFKDYRVVDKYLPLVENFDGTQKRKVEKTDSRVENFDQSDEKTRPHTIEDTIEQNNNIYMSDSKNEAKKDPRIPTLKQVEDYIAEKGYHFNASDFYSYYEASNWHLQTGNKITRWRMCCATWERNCKDKEAKKNELHERFKGYSAKTKKDTVYVNSAEMKDMYCAEGEDEWGLDEF